MGVPVLSLGQHDARHYFMLQDALILAANRLACLWPACGCTRRCGGGSRNEDRHRRAHTGVTTRGQPCYSASITTRAAMLVSIASLYSCT